MSLKGKVATPRNTPDNRAWRFTGKNFPTRQEIHAARPWNKEER
jgi:hypothetical protein